MAISFVQDFYAEGIASTIVLTVPAGGIPAGDTLIFAIVNDTSPDTISSIADASGGVNTYSEIDALTTSATQRSFLWYGKLTQTLAAASSITITISAADGGACICSQFSGLGDSSFDKKASQYENTAPTSHTSGLTATTTVADELLFGVAFFKATAAFTATGSWTQSETRSPFSVWRLATQYQIVAATGQYESTGTTVAGQTANMQIATFKTAAAPQGNIAWITA